MGTVLIRNGYIITMNERRENFFGDILVSDDRIVKVAPRIGEEEADETIDAGGKIVIPGLVQTHVHLCQTLFRSIVGDLPLLEWVENRIMPLESCHDEDSIFISARLGIGEMLKAGTTTINDMGTVGFASVIAEAVKTCGIRAQLGRTIMDDRMPDYLRHGTDRGIREAEEFIQKWHRKPGLTISCGLPVRWILSATDRALLAVGELARKYNVPIHTHANESQPENELIIKEKGLTAIEYFHEKGLTECKLQLAHCVWVSDKERQIMRECDVSVLHCPSCNLKLGSGIAPVPEFVREGINVSLGADTAACNDTLDPFVEMKLAAILQKPRLGPDCILAEDVFYMATLGGARALQLDNEIGSIEAGKKADIVILKRNLGNTPFNYERPIQSIVYSSGRSNVDTTIVDGKVLVKDGRLLVFDEDKLVNEAHVALRRVIERAISLGRYRA